jgi:hypothetical protein
MARQLRIEYVGAIYQVTSRGNEGKAVFLDETDRIYFLKIMKDVSDEHGVKS